MNVIIIEWLASTTCCHTSAFGVCIRMCGLPIHGSGHWWALQDKYGTTLPVSSW